MRKALQSPIRQIAENAGVEGSIVVGKVMDERSAAFGHDAQAGEYGDTFERGIIDLAETVRIALQDAASIARLMITTEAGVAEATKKKAGQPDHNPWRHGRHDKVGVDGPSAFARQQPLRKDAGAPFAIDKD